MVVVLSGCTRASTEGGAGRHSWTQPGVLRVAVQSDVKNLNPLLNSNTTDVFIDRLMFEPLLNGRSEGQSAADARGTRADARKSRY